MKLFNKTIDRQLFKQYALGSDLSKQEVVAKIFNPYGAGLWFILNSDPQDPDYLWAIVDLGYGAEVGSVSRSDLENYRGRFGMGFERDLSFDPINAEELYNGLSDGKYYANGGTLNKTKLFTKEDDQKLFKQHQFGNDLTKQDVVLKIYQNVGNIHYYIINADPKDPNNLLAITQNDISGDTEVDFVSRSRIETFAERVGGTTRTIDFKPINAEKLYNWLQKGNYYAKGGATKTFEYVPYKFIYRELDDEDADQVIFTPEEAEEFIQDWNRDMETDYKNWEDFNKGEEYRELEAIMIKQRKFADGGGVDRNMKVGDKVYRYYTIYDPYKEVIDKSKTYTVVSIEDKIPTFENGYSRYIIKTDDGIIHSENTVVKVDYVESNNYAKGGNIENFSDNQRMIMNQNVEVEHHHEELEDILEDKVPVPAWVVAKMETATQNLSDITHYLDGQKELMEDEIEDENEENSEEQEEIESKEVVEPINVSAGTKAEITKKFTDDAWGNLRGFLKGMEGIDLRDDYTFDYRNEQFEVEPIINSDENGVSNAVFSIFDGDGEEVGEVAYSRDGGKQKFTANSDYFQWNNAKFEDGGYFDGAIPKTSSYMSTYADGGSIKDNVEIYKLKTPKGVYYEIASKNSNYKLGTNRNGKVFYIVKYNPSQDYFNWEKLSFVDLPYYLQKNYLEEYNHIIKDAEKYSKGGEVAKAEILGLSKNIMGTTDIEMKISGMRKSQDFIVYPISKDDTDKIITIQSSTRIGKIDLSSGRGLMSQSHSNGAYFVHFQMDKLTPFTVSESDLEDIKAHIFRTAGSNVGTRGIVSDNLGASGVYAKGGMVVTSIKDIPNFKERLEQRRISYRGLGMGKLADDFYDLAGTSGTRIKVDGKEYFITDEEFDTFSRDADGKMQIRFDAPARRHEDGGFMNDVYAKGGTLKKYILKADIKTVTVKRNGKEVTYKGADVLNGANVLAKGGDISSKANYIPKRDVVEVELKDGSKIKPVNGYWVKKGAEPVNAQLTPTSSSSNPKIGTTEIRKDMRGNWRAETNIDNFNGYDWRLSTVKTYSGNLVSSAQGGKTEATGSKGVKMFIYTMYQDPNHTLEVSKPKRLTDKVVTEQHDKALAKFKKFMETGMFKGGGKISNFDKLSAKVAKEYEGKPVQSKYQEEYGKYYSKQEAKEVGDKVAGKVKAMQTNSKAFGGLFGGGSKTSSKKHPNLDDMIVTTKDGKAVFVISQTSDSLLVIDANKIGTGVAPNRINISEIDPASFE